MAYTIDAVSESLTERADLIYYLCLKKPKSPGSGEYSELITLPGRELPKRTELGADIYPGAQFDVAVFLDDFLARNTPQPDQTKLICCSDQITPYLVQVWVENAGVILADTVKTLPLEYALKGSLAVDAFAGWREQFFTTFLADSRQFLTWQPAEKWVETAQPEFLYYLVNATPKPAELWLRVDLTYSDGTLETLTPQKMTAVSQYSVYSIPVGFMALDLPAHEIATGKPILAYQVWLSNESAQRLSEVRTYYVNRDYESTTLFLLFANSLGGYDTLRCTGQTGRAITVKGTPAQRALAPDYLPTSAEWFSRDRKGEKVLTVNTGLLDGDQLDYLTELAISEEIYLVCQEGFVALVPTETTLVLRTDEEDLAGRTFSFLYAKDEIGYSALPAAPTLAARPTMWVPANTFCLINDNGLRTGYLGAATLELRYQDDSSLVKPRRSKANAAGTEGYTAPTLSGACATTPFVNALIEKPGTYKRTTCGDGLEPTVATLSIPAGTFGGETAEQLQSLVDHALQVMDTQAYANQYGACLANPAGYSYAVPANRWHYRSNVPARIGIETADAPYMGNAWTMQGRGDSFIYATPSNDLDFPTASFSGYEWRLFTYGPAGASARLRIYKNGVLYRDSLTSFNADGYQYHALFAQDGSTGYLTLVSGDKLYVQLTDL